ncbi:ubiquitin family protein [Perilla frutescens var. hirtella]|uniref:Ubiquitin family protein n=1 Tax=Perilla frutescens var. hirtella TaxID=608512 RepID=A0AAD4P7M8_PERFH|nr:ubiquitin family protein [Perilla frutescens var. hirtella]
MADLIEEDEKLVNITLRTIGPSPRSRLSLPSTLKVEELRKLIAGTTHLPLENMTLVFRGNVLHDSTNGEDSLVQLHERDTVTVAVKPKPPAEHIQDNFDDDGGEDLKFQLPESTSRWKRKLFFTLRDKIKLPNMLLMAIFSLRTKTWAAILIWFILAPFAHRLDIGPLYILGTGFLIIFYNLGHRQPGDVSAYSVFNEDFRELPGTLNADRLDRDIRLGQL